MKKTKTKVLLGLKLLSWIGLIVIFIVVSVAAVNKRQNVRCDSILVRFKQDKNLGFIQSKDILKEIHNADPAWSGQKISNIKMNLIENAIKQNSYVKNSELFLDNQNRINVVVVPKAPIARINTSSESYYLSESWDRMDLSPNYSKRIIHISGRVERLLNPISSVDSFINYEVKTILNFIDKNKIWTDAIDQIYINPVGKIELVLTFCEPLIQLGFIDENFEKRMIKLDNFLRIAPRFQNISNYQSLDFQFSNQVVARKKLSDEIQTN